MDNKTPLLITTVAKNYAEAIGRYTDAFVCGFIDGWHQYEADLLNKLDILHEINISYGLGYALGKDYGEKWSEAMTMEIED